MLNCIYDVFLTCEKNSCNDLVVMALPMFMSDAQANTREYVADDTDIGKWHDRVTELNTVDGALAEKTAEVRQFIGRHYNKLVEAFKDHNRATFADVVNECIKADEEDAGKDGDDSGEVEE